MSIFLIRGEIRIRRYMQDREEVREEFRLVRAENEDLAVEKWVDYWEKQNSPYDVAYWASALAITEMLE